MYQKTIHPTYINTGEEQFEQVNSFKYFRTMVNTDSCIEEEIKERIAAGNMAYHVHKKLFSSKLISRNVKLQLGNTLILPTVTKRTNDGYWRIKTNQEINDILKGKNIIGFIKKQRLNWLGHVERMAEDNILQKIKRWKPVSKRPIGRPKTHWEDDILEDIKSVNVCNWNKVAQNRESWKKVVEQARNLCRL